MNPIIPGFAPDPSIVRAGDTFFLVTSTFQFFPGLPIFASKDLISWSQIGRTLLLAAITCVSWLIWVCGCSGNALHKPFQADLSRTEAKLSLWQKRELMVGNRGLYAPTLRYHNGTFYIICFNVIEGAEGEQSDKEVQFIISTTDIYANEWSDPVHFEFRGGDPSLFFEDDRVYVQIAQLGDFSIQQFEIDITNGEKLTETKEILAHSGRKWPESPHIYKRGDYYYLLIAEGGCFEHHMISIARSKDIWGPYEPHPQNPILTAFETDNYIQHIGHADFVEDTKGDWWAVCLGVRKKDDCYIMGRETFLTPVTWIDDWPVISPVTPEATSKDETTHKLPQSKGFQDTKNFLHIRQKDESKYDVKSDGSISLVPGPCDITAAHGDVTFIGKCQRALEGEARVRLEPLEGVKGIKAGLAMYKDEHRSLQIFYDWTSEEICFEALNKPREYTAQKRQKLSLSGPMWLVMQYAETGYKVSYRLDGSEETVLLGTVEARMMTNYDFVGPVIGLFAVHDGTAGSEKELVKFSGFEAA